MRLRLRGRKYDHDLIEIGRNDPFSVPPPGLPSSQLGTSGLYFGDGPRAATIVFFENNPIADGEFQRVITPLLQPATQ
jgi:hypothetical protein